MGRGARQSLIRTMNDKLVCRFLIENPGMSRVDIAERAQVSVPAVLKMIDRLKAAGLVTEAGEDTLLRPGPRAVLFAMNPDYAVITGIHVRHSTLAVSHRGLDGALLSESVVDFDDQGDIASQILQASTSPRPELLQALTVALPGAVHPTTGDILVAEGLPSWAPGMAEAIRAGSPARSVNFEREVNLRAEAEHASGAAKGRDDFLMVSYGSGIGAALFLNGKLRRGAHGAAGEVGYAPAQTTPELVTYQDVAGAWILAPSLGKDHDTEFTWLHEFIESGDQEIWDQMASRISPGLLAMATLLDPELIVLSGELARISGEPLLEAVQRWMNTHAEMTAPEVRLSTLGDQAVLEGAWVRGWRNLIDLAVTPAA